MLRRHDRTETFQIANNATVVTQTNVTEVRCVIPGIYSRITTEQHQTRTDTHRTVAHLRTFRGEPDAPRGTAAISLAAQVPRHRDQLPLLLPPHLNRYWLPTPDDEEVIQTGLVCSTTGALLGLGAWALAGPAGAAVYWAIGGGLALGCSIGAFQASAIQESNESRKFAERCNAFLAATRIDGFTEGNVATLVQLQAQAPGELERTLVRDVAGLCLEYYGGQMGSRAWAALRAMAPQVEASRCLGIEATRLPLGIEDRQPQPGQRRNSL